MASFQLRNDSGSDILLADMGLPISASSSLSFDTADDFFNTIVYSENLKTNVSASDIVVVYNSADLSIVDALKFLSFQNEYIDAVEESSLGGSWTISATSPQSPSDGEGWFNTTDHILYAWDNSRSKWLSTARLLETLSKGGSCDNAYLSVNDITNTDVAGLFLPRDATLTGVEIKASSGNTNKLCYLGIDYSVITSFYIPNYSVSVSNLNVDLDKGEIAQIWVSGAGSAINDVAARIEFAWRSI